MQEPIGAVITGTRRRIKQALGARLAGTGLSTQQFGLLLAIADEPGLSLREIQARLHVDAPTASRVVSNLTSRRLVRVGGDPEDRRRCRIEATPQGRALADRIRPLRDELRRELLVGLSEDE